jgi:hypothetical protein
MLNPISFIKMEKETQKSRISDRWWRRVIPHAVAVTSRSSHLLPELSDQELRSVRSSFRAPSFKSACVWASSICFHLIALMAASSSTFLWLCTEEWPVCFSRLIQTFSKSLLKSFRRSYSL